jgi:hypothetical protein
MPQVGEAGWVLNVYPVEILAVCDDRAWIRYPIGSDSGCYVKNLTPPGPVVAWVANVYPHGVLGRHSSRDAADLCAVKDRTHVLTCHTDGTATLEAVDAND